MCRSVAKKCKFLKYPAKCLDTPSARVRIAILPIGCHNNICNVYNFHLMLVLMIWCSSPFWGFSFQPQSVSKINKYPLLQTTDFFFQFCDKYIFITSLHHRRTHQHTYWTFRTHGYIVTNLDDSYPVNSNISYPCNYQVQVVYQVGLFQNWCTVLCLTPSKRSKVFTST